MVRLGCWGQTDLHYLPASTLTLDKSRSIPELYFLTCKMRLMIALCRVKMNHQHVNLPNTQ